MILQKQHAVIDYMPNYKNINNRKWAVRTPNEISNIKKHEKKISIA